MKRSVSIFLAAMTLAACGGGGGSAASPVHPAVGPTSNPAPAPAASTGPTTASFTITIAGAADKTAQAFARKRIASGRRPAYVSPSTLGVLLTATPQGSSTPILSDALDVSPGSGICSSGSPRTCTINVPIAAGTTYAITLLTYDQVPVSGSIPAGANLLSQSTVSQSITADVPNTVNFYLDGVVATIAGGNTFASLPANGAAHSYGIALMAEDADGNPITAGSTTPYANPITVSLAESGGAGHASLVLNGTNVGTSATLSHSTDTLSLSYDGAGSPGYTTVSTIAATGVTASTLQVSPLYVTGSLVANAASQANAVSITEAGAPASVSYTSSFSCAGFTGGNGSAGSGAAGSASVTSPSYAAGSVLHSSYSCAAATISDSLGSAIAVPVGATLSLVPSCASVASNVSLGALASATSYYVGSGTPCALNVSATSATIYAPPAITGLPETASFTIAESNDLNTPAVSAPTCASVATVSPTTAAGGYTAAATGTVNIASTTLQTASPANCSVVVSDGNGQTQTVAVSSDPPLFTPTFGTFSNTFSIGCIPSPVHPGEYLCTGAGDFGLGANGVTPTTSTTTFTTTTDSIAVSYRGSVSASVTGALSPSEQAYVTLKQGGTGYCIARATAASLAVTLSANNLVITLPNGPGTYDLEFVGTTNFDDNSNASGSGSASWYSSVAEAANGTGTAIGTGIRGC